MFALMLLGVYGVTTWRMATLHSLGVKLDDVRISSDHLMMANPTYAGYGKDGSRHSVRARLAETDIVAQKRVKLTTIEGEVVQQSGSRIELSAVRGLFEQESGILELMEQIDVRSNDGMSAKLTSATVFTKENKIVSNEPIVAEMPTGSLRAQKMELDSKRRLATFTGNIAVRMKPQQTPRRVGSEPKEKPNTLGPSFASNEPVDVTSDRLTVDDEKHVAMFRDNVVARQGAATLVAPELDATYAGRGALPVPAAPAAADQAASRLSSLEARGGVVMTRDTDRATATTLHYDAEAQRTVLTGPVQMTSGADRRASSASAEIDHKADRFTLLGTVVVNQGRNVLKGERLAIDRAAGRARLESPADAARPAGRISVLLHRNEQANGRTKAAGEAGDNRVVGGFQADPSAPIEIDAATLDFEDARRLATFSGSVVAKQGEFVIRTPTLTALFAGQASLLAVQAAPKTNDAAASLKKIEARGGVVVTGKDGQKVTGDWADFDPQANFATVGGRVIVSQGKNVVEGSKLVIDLTSGRTRFETGGPIAEASKSTPAESAVPCVAGQTCTSQRRVRAVFYPKDANARLGKRSLPTPTRAPRPSGTRTSPRGESSSSWQSSTTKAPEATGTPR